MTADRPRLFVLASLRAPDLDCGSRLTGIAATKESGGERAWPLIMTWCPDKRAVNKGQLTGVIDFGLLAVGDPAVDLMAAWTFLSGPARHAFRTALPADEATWERGRGWALELGIRCAAYAAGNSLLGEIGKYTIRQVLTE